MFSSHSFGLAEPQYLNGADDNLLVIVQIESQKGVDNVVEIAQVDGIDVLFVGKRTRGQVGGKDSDGSVGPYDLSKFMNVEFGGQEHEAAIAKVLKAAHDAGKTAAIFCEFVFKNSLLD